MNPILAKSIRSGIVDNVYRGIYAVVREGKVIRKGGDIDRSFFMRSSEKKIQAAVVVESGAADAFGLIDEEIAVIAGSHSGEDFHVAAVRSILKKGGLDESYLKCGVHPPTHEPTREALLRAGKPFESVHNNCSGKHAGMLLASKHLGFSLEDYLGPEHPVQQRIFDRISLLSEYDAKRIRVGVDGCGVPTYAIPVRNMAVLYANLSTPDRFPKQLADACRRVAACVYKHPLMVGGHNRFCTDIIEEAGAKLVAKDGVEGIFNIGILGAHTGIAVKVECGLNQMYEGFLVNLLKELGIVTEAEVRRLAKYVRQPVLNHRGEEVGYIEAKNVNDKIPREDKGSKNG